MDNLEIVTPKNLTALPYIKDRYYVYALFKKDSADPFYIGKGKNNRVNQHFAPWSLKDNNRKNKTIKKHWGNIRRDILCYFDDEGSAFDFEEYLISYYGLANEGGCLFNVAKSRSDIPEVRKKAIDASLSSRAFVYTEEEVLTLYRNYFEKRLSFKESIVGTTIPLRYSYSIVKQRKSKTFYNKYILSGLVKNLRQPEDDKIERGNTLDISDKELITSFENVCSLKSALREEAKLLGVSRGWLGDVFLGKHRKELNLDSQRYKARSNGHAVNKARRYEKFLSLYPGTSIDEISTIIGTTKSCVWAYIVRYKEDLEHNSTFKEASWHIH